ncbi:hypothetical protein EJV46_14095 [Roseococcus sp. SYP-B2431]|uniref:hypothetical protein n=1 Tax=Roseococcus sp. SYP-B2431 TaxID=2496640 RepID=UPI00103DECF9|nr:hypothetical protein [Roseococcus sp. SYP-B2431]TCH98309.1 hypothetical protein EJV46_14095 [Roseococcus sp. SYP-B2431]
MTFLARASAGLMLWAFGFSLLYALHGIGCAGGWDEVAMAGATLFRWALVGTWCLLCLGAVALMRRAWAAPAGFERGLGLVSALAGLAAILVTGAPVVLTSACA